jgi:hypothetical protein
MNGGERFKWLVIPKLGLRVYSDAPQQRFGHLAEERFNQFEPRSVRWREVAALRSTLYGVTLPDEKTFTGLKVKPAFRPE